MDTPKPKPRRKRGCAREGCKRGVRDGYRCCSYLCNVVTERWSGAAYVQGNRRGQCQYRDVGVVVSWVTH